MPKSPTIKQKTNTKHKLYCASARGDIEQVRMLLSTHSYTVEDASVMLRHASRNNHLQVLDLLLQHGANPTHPMCDALSKACEKGHAEIVSRLLSSGADPNEHDGLPLVEAATHGHLGIVRCLLQAKSDPCLNESNALVCACEGAHEDIVDLLYPISNVHAALRVLEDDASSAAIACLNTRIQASVQHTHLHNVLGNDASAPHKLRKKV